MESRYCRPVRAAAVDRNRLPVMEGKPGTTRKCHLKMVTGLKENKLYFTGYSKTLRFGLKIWVNIV